ncbi:MAG: PDZ domain-containing protein [Chloroflexota bacterium]
MASSNASNPLSSRVLLGGIIVTVVGGLILAFLLTKRDIPPHNGAFIKESRFDYVELPRVSSSDADDVHRRGLGAPVTSARKPTIVIWEPRMDLGNLVLDEEEGGLGVQLGLGYYDGTVYPGIASVSSGGGASQAGVQANDLITVVDGVSTANYDTSQVSGLLRGPVGTTVNIVMNRNGVVEQYRIIRTPIDTRGPVPVELRSEDDMVYLTPLSDLTTGTHCLAAGSFLLPYSMIPNWCFVVQY